MNRRYERKSIYEIRSMSYEELRGYRIALKKRKERIHRIQRLAFALIATMILTVVCTLTYSSLKTNANKGFKYYTSVCVESGDTLWELSDRYIDYDYYEDKESYLLEVRMMNRLNDDTIYAGQTIVLPYYSSEYKY